MVTKDGQCPLCGCTYSVRFLRIHAAKCGEERDIHNEKKRPRVSSSERNTVKSNLLMDCAKRKQALLRPLKDKENEIGAPGFFVFEEVMDVETEARIWQMAHDAEPKFTDNKYRFSKAYGPPYNISERRFDFTRRRYPLPDYATKLVLPILRERIAPVKDFHPNQLSAQIYDPNRQNVHIMPHNDCENGELGDLLIGVTLNAACTMTLILQAQHTGLGKDMKRDVRLRRRSVYIMSGPALRVFRHAIFEGNTDMHPAGGRLSLTFRDVILPDNVGFPRHSFGLPSQQTSGARAAIEQRSSKKRVKGKTSPVRTFKQLRLSFPRTVTRGVTKKMRTGV